MRTALIIQNGEPVNAIVLPKGKKGDALLSNSCVEVTNLDPQPGVGNGWTYVEGEFVPPPVPALTWDDVRAIRDRRLASSDWTQVSDAPVDAAAWATYRQQLRDLPQNYILPEDVEWPEEPA